MKRTQESCYYYSCTPDMFVINVEDECLEINHIGDLITIAFYEMTNIGIDLSEEYDYLFHISCGPENHYFQFCNQAATLAVCVKVLSQISQLYEHRGIS